MAVMEKQGVVDGRDRVLAMPGALAWCELVTRDPDAARRFYGDWLGWEMRGLASR